ncbi:MAG TPA: isocitrate lyase/phosphoenolpyruvate mutase family protein [Kiloniellaceae bacterium]|nr:isocitrate lyase/phosphoenolpyruvate mutase family protein [Kiloniellaceae bacterium]
MTSTETAAEKAKTFAALHRPGHPVVLYNIWDAGGAKTLAKAGAKAVATGSWSVAAAQGFGDGEAIPLDLVLTLVARITATVDLPVTVDFEGAYAEAPAEAAANLSRLLEAGAIGINFEDQVVGGEGLHAPGRQAERIAALRGAAEAAGVPVFINARTDLFLKERDRAKHEALLAEAVDRAAAYAEAGASGFFAPALVEPGLIRRLCDQVDLPVNIMMLEGAPSLSELAALGVARISYGPGPYVEAMARLAERFGEVTALS